MGSPTNVRKQVNSNSYYFSTIPGGRAGGRVAGRVAGGIENKANSVQFQLKLSVGTELGKTTSKSKTIKISAKQMNKLCKNTLLDPLASAGQLFSLAATCSTTEILTQELKTLLDPDHCSDWRSQSYVKCQECAPPDKMSTRDQLQKEKLNQNSTRAEHVSIGQAWQKEDCCLPPNKRRSCKSLTERK